MVRVKRDFTPDSMLRWLWLSLGVFLLDQASKWWIVSQFKLYESFDLFPGLRLFYVHNTGAAFSFLSDAAGWQRWFFAGIAVLASGLVFFWLKGLQRGQIRLAAGLAFVLGGALGNLYDRLAYGYVIDFIDVYYQSWHWPVFNLADSAITLGVILILLDSFFGDAEKSASDSTT